MALTSIGRKIRSQKNNGLLPLTKVEFLSWKNKQSPNKVGRNWQNKKG